MKFESKYGIGDVIRYGEGNKVGVIFTVRFNDARVDEETIEYIIYTVDNNAIYIYEKDVHYRLIKEPV